MIHLHVIRGANLGEELKTRRSVVSVGRSAECDLVLSDKQVSHLHGEFLADGSRCVYRDLLSRNGSLVHSGDETFWLGPLAPEWEVEPGDEILVGNTTIRVEAVTGADARISQDREYSAEGTIAPDEDAPEILGAECDATAEIVRFHDFLRLNSYDATSVKETKNLLCDGFMEVFPNAACVALIDLLPGCGRELAAKFVNARSAVCRMAAPASGAGVARFSLHVLAEAYRRRRLVLYGSDKAMPDAQSIREGQMESCICAPLWRGKEVRRFLHLHTVAGHGPPFARRDAQLVCLLANIASLLLNRAADAKQRSAMRTAAAAGLAVSGLAHDAQSILKTLGLNMEGVEMAHPKIASDNCWEDVKADLELLRFITRDAIERLTTATGDLHPRRTRLHPTVDDILRRCKEYFADQADRVRVKLVNRCQQAHVAVVDPQGLKQALMNCIKNSLRAMKELSKSGTVPNGSGEVWVVSCDDPDAPRGSCLVSVCDNAGGIPDKVLRRLGQPFVTMKERGRLGLGMYIAMDIIGRMGGQIRIATSTKAENGCPAGTVVSFCLPKTKGADGLGVSAQHRLIVVPNYPEYRAQIEGALQGARS